MKLHHASLTQYQPAHGVILGCTFNRTVQVALVARPGEEVTCRRCLALTRPKQPQARWMDRPISPSSRTSTATLEYRARLHGVVA